MEFSLQSMSSSVLRIWRNWQLFIHLISRKLLFVCKIQSVENMSRMGFFIFSVAAFVASLFGCFDCHPTQKFYRALRCEQPRPALHHLLLTKQSHVIRKLNRNFEAYCFLLLIAISLACRLNSCFLALLAGFGLFRCVVLAFLFLVPLPFVTEQN